MLGCGLSHATRVRILCHLLEYQVRIHKTESSSFPSCFVVLVIYSLSITVFAVFLFDVPSLLLLSSSSSSSRCVFFFAFFLSQCISTSSVSRTCRLYSFSLNRATWVLFAPDFIFFCCCLRIRDNLKCNETKATLYLTWNLLLILFEKTTWRSLVRVIYLEK